MKNKSQDIILSQIRLRDCMIKEQEAQIITLSKSIRIYKNSIRILLSLLFISIIANVLLFLR